MLRITTLLLLATSCALADEDRYRITFSPGLERAVVEVCFSGSTPRTLYRHRDAARYTISLRSGHGDRVPAGNGSRLRLPDLPADSCLEWQIDLAAAMAQSDYRLAMGVGGSLVTSANLLFWRDNERRPLRIEVSLPAGHSISAPWAEADAISDADADAPETPVFRPVATPASWSSRIAVGRFPIQRLEVPGSELRLAAIGDLSKRQRAKLARWILQTGESVASVYGHFPQGNPQVLIVPIGRRNEPVPWARVVRGGGVAAEFYVDETRPLREFLDDWTASHEFSHFLLPYVSYDHRWLSEGLASYYQNILRARDGRLSEREAWQKIRSGLQRGQDATGPGSLASAVRSGRAATMRVYWSGAAMMLKADARLRATTDGRHSLDTALAGLQACCLEPARSWEALELFSELDRITDTRVFRDLYDAHVHDDEFPDLSETWRRLGLETSSNRLDPDAPWGHIRRHIMRGGAAGG
ncbi:MAG: hypothetical protein RQ826_17145 [Xanthomonadales bacterium]|nr:hypothetical protein [Xanthomonadales bacterium]